MLVDKSVTSHTHCFFFMVRKHTYTVSLPVVTALYIRAPECAHLTAGSLCPRVSISPCSPLPGPERLPLCSVFLWLLDSTYTILHIACFSDLLPLAQRPQSASVLWIGPFLPASVTEGCVHHVLCICWWTLGRRCCPGGSQERCGEHGGADGSLGPCFHFLLVRAQKWRCWIL